MRRLLSTLTIVVAILSVGFAAGQVLTDHLSSSLPDTLRAAPPACQLGPSAGQMGVCAPRSPFGQLPPLIPGLAGKPKFVDLSNNNPVGRAGMRAIKRRGYVGVILKANQAGYVDPTFVPMVRAARAAGLDVGGYDFLDPTRASARADATTFVHRIKAAGICKARGTFAPALDVEYGAQTRGSVLSAVRTVVRACGRAMIYTGAWYWNPHIGCYWPAGRAGWISGYGSLTLPCGIGARLRAHQYSDREFNGANVADSSVYVGGDLRGFVHRGRTARAIRRARRLRTLRGWLATRRRQLHRAHAPTRRLFLRTRIHVLRTQIGALTR